MVDQATLLPPNATILERVIEQVIAARQASISTALRSLWDPDLCPVDFLPFLAWQFSVDRWNPDWPVAVKRSVVRSSVSVHRIKGTRKAVSDVIAALGAVGEIVEWWETDPPGDAGTFVLNLLATDSAGDLIDEAMQDDILAAVDGAKRLSQHYDVVLGVPSRAGLVLSPIVSAIHYYRFDATLSGEI